MKGIIIQCLKEVVVSKYGLEVWEISLVDSGFKAGTIFPPAYNAEDTSVKVLFNKLCENLEISYGQLADDFGDYWVNKFSQKLYSHIYLKHKKAKDFLLDMDRIHVTMTKNIKNAHPPRFEYEWKDEFTLIMYYKSHRGMIDILTGLIKGVAKYYNEELTVEKGSKDRVIITFKEKQDLDIKNFGEINCIK